MNREDRKIVEANLYDKKLFGITTNRERLIKKANLLARKILKKVKKKKL